MKVLCSQEVVRPDRCGVVLCQGTAQASAPQVPWFVLGVWLQQGVRKAMAWAKPIDFPIGGFSPPEGRLVVRLQWRLISTVQVRVGVCHTSVAEGDCVTARWGGKQLEANPRSVGGRTRFGGMSRRAFD